MMHPKVEDALDEIDAMVFTGDELCNGENRKRFGELLARWGRKLQEFEDDYKPKPRKRRPA